MHYLRMRTGNAYGKGRDHLPVRKRNIVIYCRYFIEQKCDIRFSTLLFVLLI